MENDLVLVQLMRNTVFVCMALGVATYVIALYQLRRNTRLNNWLSKNLWNTFIAACCLIMIPIAGAFLPLTPVVQLVLVGLMSYLGPVLMLLVTLIQNGLPHIRRKLDVEAVVKELQTLYPGKNIIVSPEKTEVICELERTADYSKIIAITEKSDKHYHLKATEYYRVLRGRLVVHTECNGKKYRDVLAPGLTTSVPPNVIQWTEGVDDYEDTWVEAECRPPWTPEDHIKC